MGYKKIEHENYTIVENDNGMILGISNAPIIEADGYAFKDLARAGTLLPFEDWRLDADTRAKDLAQRLTIEQIAGLMLYSSHQMIPSLPGGPFQAHYDGVSYPESGKHPWEMSDEQKTFLSVDNIRHVLVMKLQDASVAARWNNEMQRFAENLPFGIPINTSSDPRHGAADSGVEYKSAGADVSKWPEGIGMSATFSPEVCSQFAEIAAKEYRALGISTALSPQIDLATEPRWMRYADTFGAHIDLTIDMTKAYCDGMQTTKGKPDGWGNDSVVTMAKHWPGGGTGESGRDAHYPFGKYAVYPGDNFDLHMKPFTKGALSLDGPTKSTAAIMPYYTVSWNQDNKNGDNVGNSYNEYIIHDLLREKYGYKGVVCTDWGITGAIDQSIDSFGSRCYGVENLTEAEQHLRIIINGIDQFGGNNKKEPIVEAYNIGCETYGQDFMRGRMEESAVRLLRNIFQLGLFENPYLNPEESVKLVGCEAFQKAGYKAQLMSIVMLKNTNNCLPLKEKPKDLVSSTTCNKLKVYVPERQIKAKKNFFRRMDEAKTISPVSNQLLKEYFIPVDTPEEADVALVFLESPDTDGYSSQDLSDGGNGYMPISLQYRPYTANTARKQSIAGGDVREEFINRSYYGKTTYASNEQDLDNVITTKELMGDKPVIACITMHNPAVLAELEPYADAILVDFGVSRKAILDIITGIAQPNGLLPVQLPLNMETVEKHCEDLAFDIEPYTDSVGATYNFGYGMNWNGIISDARTKKYSL
ncbi:MAG: glycoside hydrolase family 3 protein [Herbinix sp.]|jgi:beta-glucosidase|nr:glycoside hydrolase family 3 protein [Herbinix sp.]